nr:MAG TPA: hypothetical protein [Caudoviricetes sp.]
MSPLSPFFQVVGKNKKFLCSLYRIDKNGDKGDILLVNRIKSTFLDVPFDVPFFSKGTFFFCS